MNCQHCQSERVLIISAKCSDLCYAEFQGIERNGYIPSGVGIGSGDYLEFKVCLNCGQQQGEFPVPDSVVLEAFPEPEKPDVSPEWEEHLDNLGSQSFRDVQVEIDAAEADAKAKLSLKMDRIRNLQIRQGN